MAAAVLAMTAWLRGPEYDEAYSLFLTAGHARPAWPHGVFTPGGVRGLYTGHAGLAGIAHDLRRGDVHPPLYFWVLEFWRRTFGPSWFAARLLSVACSVAALAVLGRLAALAEVPAVPAIAVALLSYGFAYTGIVARGFALAQLFNLVGVACILAAGRHRDPRLAFGAGLAFGAASFVNYLAIFTGFAALAWLALKPKCRRLLRPATLGLILFMPLDAWFFLAQRNARIGQFVAFSWRHALPLLAKDSGATLFGGLPLYAGRFGTPVTLALAVLTLFSIAAIIRAWRPPFGLFAWAAAATPIGLLALGVVFHNTPIEIRYLAFSTPFIALICAAALPRPLLALLLAVDAAAIAGLAFAPATMQPQGAAARAATAFATPASLVLLPYGNDGVGIPGPFIAASPDPLRLELLHARMPDLSGETRVILARVAADDASRAALAAAQAYFANPCWQRRQQTRLAAIYLNRCRRQPP